ncbi:hypothetical protein ACIA5D_46545 [Actinoplanes sp. NPDC051513]|uniref:hypothetical protein n=1 Tax=Actinoplanes sp. NPDC051513 TaxID=3363908 RepID=UPI00379ECDE8
MLDRYGGNGLPAQRGVQDAVRGALEQQTRQQPDDGVAGVQAEQGELPARRRALDRFGCYCDEIPAP